MSKYVYYYFGNAGAKGSARMKSLPGGKGANLAEMANLEIHIPPRFTISIEICNYFYKHDNRYPQGLTE